MESDNGETRPNMVVENVHRVLPVFAIGTSFSPTPGVSPERILEEERLAIAWGMLGG